MRLDRLITVVGAHAEGEGGRVITGGVLPFCMPADSCGSADGAQGRNRTTDTAIFSRMLYQLSYLGAAAWVQKSRGIAARLILAIKRRGVLVRSLTGMR